MSLQVQVIENLTGKIVQLEVDKNETVENLKALVEVEFGIPINEQQLLCRNVNMQDKDNLQKYNIQDNDLLIVRRKQLSQQNTNQNRALQEAQQIKAHYEQNPDQLQLILHQNPEFAAIVLSDNINELVHYLNLKKQEKIKEQMAQMQRIAQLEADPFNPESQKLIEQEINRKNVQQNLEFAQEYQPENFGQINMLYVEIVVNKHPVQVLEKDIFNLEKAFVDSGAQSTIMSKACAERCGIMRLVDTRYAGMALGVGMQRILGRIHIIEVQIMDKFLPCSLTILEGDSIDFLLGLDMLKRYQCSIDLQQNKLIFPTMNIQVPFLGEGDVKKHISLEQEKQLLEQSQKEEEQAKKSTKKPEPQQQQRPQQQQQQQQQQPNNSTEQSITTLMNMGFTRQQVVEALRQAGGNAEIAASILTQSRYGF